MSDKTTKAVSAAGGAIGAVAIASGLAELGAGSMLAGTAVCAAIPVALCLGTAGLIYGGIKLVEWINN